MLKNEPTSHVNAVQNWATKMSIIAINDVINFYVQEKAITDVKTTFHNRQIKGKYTTCINKL